MAAGILMGSFLLSPLLGLLRNALIGAYFGNEPDAQAYWSAFLVPDLLWQVVTGAALGSAFIPTFTGYLKRGEEAEGWRMASAVITLLALVTALLAAIAWLAMPWAVGLIAPGYEGSQRELTIELTRWMLLSPVIFSVSGIFMGILQARQHFLLPALAPLVYNLSIIGAAVALHEPFGVRGLAWGVVLGSLLHLLIQVPGLIRHGMRYQFRLTPGDRGVREVGRLMLPRMVSLGAAQVNFLVANALASTLPNSPVPPLNYAWRLTLMPLGLFGMAISTAVFPTLAGHAALDAKDELRQTLGTTLRIVLFLTIPSSVGLILLGHPLVALLFQRGEFGADAVNLTAGALLFFGLGLFGHAIVEVVARGFYALKDTRTTALTGLLAMLAHAALAVALMGPLGIGGIALAMSIVTVVESLTLLLVLSRRVGGMDLRGVGRSALITVVGSGVLALWVANVVIFGNRWDGRTVVWLGIVVVGIGGGALLFVWTSFALQSAELDALLEPVWRRLLRRRAAPAENGNEEPAPVPGPPREEPVPQPWAAQPAYPYPLPAERPNGPIAPPRPVAPAFNPSPYLPNGGINRRPAAPLPRGSQSSQGSSFPRGTSPNRPDPRGRLRPNDWPPPGRPARRPWEPEPDAAGAPDGAPPRH